MKIATIVGARPQFIKATMVSRALAAVTAAREILIHTGQHYDQKLSKSFFDDLDIPAPDHNLDVGSATHGVQTGKMLQRLEPLLADHRPDWVIVYGDTNSTLAGALTAAKLHLPIAHIEAGLRSFNRSMPEEINRIVTDHISDLLFAPAQMAVDNLQREGIAPQQVHLVGDVMQDAAVYYAALDEDGQVAGRDPVGHNGPYVLATVHRPENTDNPDRLTTIFDAFNQLAEEFPVILPLHPRTKVALEQNSIPNITHKNLQIIEPVGYLEMLRLERRAAAIVTDSGGLQKEAYFHRVPCVTLRDETEWTELLQWGCNRRISPISAAAIVQEIRAALQEGFPTGTPADLYGDGKAAEKIARILVSDRQD